MLYIVEMALYPGHTDAEWQRWESEMKSAELFMSVPGFRSAQRFKGVTDPLAYCAVYSVASAEVMTSPGYLGIGGGVRVGHWNDRIAYWHRDTAEGLGIAPAVAEDHVLLMKKTASLDFADEGLPFIRLTTVGLNRSVPYRGVAILPAAEAMRRVKAGSDIQIYSPIAPQLLNVASSLPQ